MKKKTILIVEDELSIVDNIVYGLKTDGFDCLVANQGSEGLNLLNEQDVDLVILDVGLPDMSGFEVCKKIRESSQVPIIFLTARSEEIDRVLGLEIGGDDYVLKPFSVRELVARVKTILKRGNPTVEAVNHVVGDFSVDSDKAQIIYCTKALRLTHYEYEILKMLIESPERVYSRDQIMERIWESPGSSTDRTVDTHIKSIRSKIHQITPDKDPIQTRRGMGYSFSEDSQ